MALDGDILVVGAPHTESTKYEEGQVFVFERDGQGDWDETAKLVPSGMPDGDPKAEFGQALAVDGNTIVVGAPLALYNGVVYEVYVFAKNSDGAWVEEAAFKIDEMPLVYGAFGWSVAVEGDTAVVGAPSQTNALLDAVMVYEREQESGEWLDEPAFLPAGDAVNQRFGNAVAIEGGVIAAADSSRVHLFAKAMGEWAEFSSTPMSTVSTLGAVTSVYLAFDGQSIVVAGAEPIDGEEESLGSVHIYGSHVWMVP